MINPMELTGKHILITGGSSGIGRQCAIQASRLGARVTLISRSEEKLRETIRLMDRPEDHAYYSFDLNETERIEPLIKTIAAERGAVDGFVHAAGIAPPRMLKQTKPQFVEKMFRIHGYAFIELIRSLTLKNYLKDGASLVGISSVAAEKGNPSQEAYTAVKASMNAFVRPVAQELAVRKIRINTVAYAMVDTDMFQDFLGYSIDGKVMERQLLGVIDVDSAANVVMFLLGDACKYITASTIPVYAGC